MSAWTEFALALAAFLGSHVIPARPHLRGALVGALGKRGYILAYSVLSLALLVWLIAAAGRAPYVPLWDAGGFGRGVVHGAMPLAIAVAALSPGLAGLMPAFTIWGLSHLVANGDVAHVVLFGLLLAYALAGLARVGRPRLRVTPWRLLAIPLVWIALIAAHPYVVGVPVW